MGCSRAVMETRRAAFGMGAAWAAAATRQAANAAQRARRMPHRVWNSGVI